MKRIILAILLLATIAGCEPRLTEKTPAKKERPTVNLPLVLRQKNWLGPQREGSCTWASMLSLLRWQGHYKMADWIRKNYGDGEWPDDMAQKLDKAGVRYAYVTNGDVEFLEWACKTRRGCGITVMGGAHMVCLVYLDDKWAALLDNNRVEKFIWVPRETLIAEWKASLGWAVTPVYSPCPPLPSYGR
jgi:hypothetical protein